MTVRTRFAPSPTGFLHIGGVRTALFNWIFAKQHGGQFVLRIDDTDQQRNVEAALQPILDGFRWLGIDWDEGPEVGGPYEPYFQSQRSGNYSNAVTALLNSGHAYRDFAKPEEVQAERESAEKAKVEFVYSRKWMAENDEQAAAFEAGDRSFIVRLKMPREGSCQFTDLVRGDVEFAWAREQDHVIQRADGTCLYHLANVVDDHDFKITHVIRAIEHLSNTPRQIFIAQCLGYDLPEFAHLPFVAEPGSKNKLSKRKIEKYLKNREFKKLYDQGEKIARQIDLQVSPDTFNPVLVDFYRAIGFLPDAIVNYLLLLGWSLDDKTEDFSREEMLKHFSMERIVKAPASFDPAKLQVFQERRMQQYPLDQKILACIPFLQKKGLIPSELDAAAKTHVAKIVEAASDRIKCFGDILGFEDFFVSDDKLSLDEKAIEKRLRKPEDAVALVHKFREVLANTEDFSAGHLDQVLHAFVESEEIKIGQIIHALRVATTGKAVGFGMFDTLEILGKERCLRRIDMLLKHVESTP